MNKLEEEKFKSAGINIIDPATTFIDSTVKFVGSGITINPNTHLKGDTKINSNCNIGPNSFLHDAVINKNTKVIFSFIENSLVGENCEIGPYSRVRNKSSLENNVVVGNFAEIKNSSIGKNSKINHYCYIGDAVIGSEVNIGAGVVTCNYNGKIKSSTQIGDNCFIGSSTMLIAPLKIGNDSITGAGSVVTKNIGSFVTVVGNPAKILDNSKNQWMK